MKAICEQHEDKPNWAAYNAGTHAAGKAHKRILELFEDEKCLRYLKVLQGRATRGDSAPEVCQSGLTGFYSIAAVCQGNLRAVEAK